MIPATIGPVLRRWGRSKTRTRTRPQMSTAGRPSPLSLLRGCRHREGLGAASASPQAPASVIGTRAQPLSPGLSIAGTEAEFEFFCGGALWMTAASRYGTAGGRDNDVASPG